MTTVMVVFGASDRSQKNGHLFERVSIDKVQSLFGVPLYKHDGHSVYMWAIDNVSCNDKRWIAFGPFANRGAALTAWAEKLAGRLEVAGYHLLNEHCLPDKYGKNGDDYPHSAWTDG